MPRGGARGHGLRGWRDLPDGRRRLVPARVHAHIFISASLKATRATCTVQSGTPPPFSDSTSCRTAQRSSCPCPCPSMSMCVPVRSAARRARTCVLTLGEETQGLVCGRQHALQGRHGISYARQSRLWLRRVSLGRAGQQQEEEDRRGGPGVAGAGVALEGRRQRTCAMPSSGSASWEAMTWSETGASATGRDRRERVLRGQRPERKQQEAARPQGLRADGKEEGRGASEVLLCVARQGCCVLAACFSRAPGLSVVGAMPAGFLTRRRALWAGHAA